MRRYRGFGRDERAAIVSQILARDGPICGVRREPLDLEISPDHPAATTIDQIVGLRDGGEIGGVQQLDNLRPAHSLCHGRRVRYDERLPTWFAAEIQRALRRWSAGEMERDRA
jgi:hypothetical protein